MDCDSPIAIQAESGLEVAKPLSHHDSQQINWPAQKDVSSEWETAHHADAELDGRSRKPGRTCQQGRILGLSVLWFWIVIGTLVIILAGAIGGGIAGGMTQKRKLDTEANIDPELASASVLSSTSAPTSAQTSLKPSSTTSNSVAPSSTSASGSVISSPCQSNPAVNGTIVDSIGIDGTTAYAYVYCGWSPSTSAIYSRLLALWVPDMGSCIAACADWNENGYYSNNTCDVATINFTSVSCILISLETIEGRIAGSWESSADSAVLDRSV